jgi:hypothetical protein
LEICAWVACFKVKIFFFWVVVPADGWPRLQAVFFNVVYAFVLRLSNRNLIISNTIFEIRVKDRIDNEAKWKSCFPVMYDECQPN